MYVKDKFITDVERKRKKR